MISSSASDSLRSAMATVHRDPQWWLKCLAYGGMSLSLVGLPIASGFVIESFDSTRRGYPTPLPPWGDWGNRGLIGIFGLLVDFVFYVLPVLVSMIVLVCSSMAMLIVSGFPAGRANMVLLGLSLLCGAFLLSMFLCSVSPAGRMRFVREGKIEEALSFSTLRWATAAPIGGFFLRARLSSLLLYVPALLCGGGAFWLSTISFPARSIVVALMLWLAASAVVYAHLVIVQLYSAADRAAERRRLGM